jgi:hypothetical protein
VVGASGAADTAPSTGRGATLGNGGIDAAPPSISNNGIDPDLPMQPACSTTPTSA